MVPQPVGARKRISPKGDGFYGGKFSTFLGILRRFQSIFGRRFFVSLKYKADKSPNQDNASDYHEPMWILEGRHPSFPLRLLGGLIVFDRVELHLRLPQAGMAGRFRPWVRRL
jgi:hypothetical protein